MKKLLCFLCNTVKGVGAVGQHNFVIFSVVIFASVIWAAPAGATAFVYEYQSDIACGPELGALRPDNVSFSVVVPHGSVPHLVFKNITSYYADVSASTITLADQGVSHGFPVREATVYLNDHSGADTLSVGVIFDIGVETWLYESYMFLDDDDYYTLYPSNQSSFVTSDVTLARQEFWAVHYDGNSLIYDGLVCRDDPCTSLISTASATPVPEPTTMLLFGAGLVGLAGFGRKKV